MKILSIESGKISIAMGDIDVTIGGIIYKNLTFIARLLTYDELLRLESIAASSEYASILMEEDLFDTVIERILGFPEDQTINKDDMEAGIVSTISYAIMTKSLAHIVNAGAHTETYMDKVSVIDSMQVVVARYTSTPISEVVKYPINILFSRFAAIKKTFPYEFQEGQ